MQAVFKLLKKFSQSWPKHEKPEKWIVKNKNSIPEKINYKLYINPYIKYDPTLPRVNNLVCPNNKCTKKKDEDSLHKTSQKNVEDRDL